MWIVVGMSVVRMFAQRKVEIEMKSLAGCAALPLTSPLERFVCVDTKSDLLGQLCSGSNLLIGVR